MSVPQEDWHARPAHEVLEALRSTPQGLDAQEAVRRLAQLGPNALPVARRRGPLVRFLAQFNNALIYFLLAAAIAAGVLGHLIDAIVIMAVIFVNAVIGFVQEGKAEQALAAMRRLISPKASVRRDGVRTSVAATELVPGDIVLLEAGDRVPADLRLLRARGMLVDEALLTGESVAAEKKESSANRDAALGDRHCMVYSGTLVAAGQATGVVVDTGVRTQIGRISALLQEVDQLTTPLLRQINQFSRRFTVLALIASVLLFAFAVLVRDFDPAQALIAVVALAVGAIPEGLPAVITITFAIGVQRMAACNAVIRRLPAVETLGATSVICSDKTGTLTRNEMTARRTVTARHELEVSGAGYAPQGALEAVGHDDDSAAIADAAPLLRCGLLCNDALLSQRDGVWTVEGDPMEGALLALAMKTGINPEHARAEWPRLDEIPFDAMHRFMATLHRSPTGEAFVFIKGAPEQILNMALPPGPERVAWEMRIAAVASAGERLLGFASKRLPGEPALLRREDLATGLDFGGIVGFIDPPRPEAVRAIAECRAAGIEVKMITGDHASTALAIARQLQLAAEPLALTGADLDALQPDEFAERVRRTAVFARTSPEHKLRIVRALQAEGQVVAMTGDGVNDAPSLKQADVGVAMGIKGTEAAKEAAEMVLLDDNFATIVNAVHEGRTVYHNIRKVIAWTLPTNGGEVMTVLAAIAFGFTLPMSAVQILWINLVTAITLGLVLAFEPAEPGVMGRPPRSSHAPLLTPFMLWRVVLVSTLFLAAGLGVFFHALAQGRDLETARTLVVNTIVVMDIFYLFNVRYLGMTSITLRGALGTPAVLIALAVVVAAQFAFTYLPAMQTWFGTRALSLGDGAVIIAIGAGMMVLLELEKLLLRRLGVPDLQLHAAAATSRNTR